MSTTGTVTLTIPELIDSMEYEIIWVPNGLTLDGSSTETVADSAASANNIEVNVTAGLPEFATEVQVVRSPAKKAPEPTLATTSARGSRPKTERSATRPPWLPARSLTRT